MLSILLELGRKSNPFANAQEGIKIKIPDQKSFLTNFLPFFYF
jgi:hypothetical protein